VNDPGAYSGGGVVWGSNLPPFLRKIFQFARVFEAKNAKTLPKFSRQYKKISKPLPRKISGYAPGMTYTKGDAGRFEIFGVVQILCNASY